jgi:hypothetical protein
VKDEDPLRNLRRRHQRYYCITLEEAKSLGVDRYVPCLGSPEFCKVHSGTFVSAETGKCLLCIRDAARTRASLKNAQRKAKAPQPTANDVAKKMLREIRGRCRKDGYQTDVTREWICEQITAGLAAGTLRIGARSPWTPSIDQRYPGLGYVVGNVQIVPFWFNLAKNNFDEAEISAAIKAWSATQ